MARSYRKPYCAITGTKSAKQDKIRAHRGVRRAQDEYVRRVASDVEYWDEVPMPVMRECHWNNTYGWGRDGCQSLQFPPRPPNDDSEFKLWWFEHQIKWYAKLHRK